MQNSTQNAFQTRPSPTGQGLFNCHPGNLTVAMGTHMNSHFFLNSWSIKLKRAIVHSYFKSSQGINLKSHSPPNDIAIRASITKKSISTPPILPIAIIAIDATSEKYLRHPFEDDTSIAILVQAAVDHVLDLPDWLSGPKVSDPGKPRAFIYGNLIGTIMRKQPLLRWNF